MSIIDKNDFIDGAFNDIEDISLKQFLHENFINVIRFFNTDQKFNFSPFITGYNLIFMIDGPWKSEILNISKKYNLNYPILSYNSTFFNKTFFPILARNINIPEPQKEYQNITTRSTSITHYSREIEIPDFSIDYVDNHDLVAFRYHETWFKVIELYRRGVPELEYTIRSNAERYFYDVPYMNAIWVLGFTPAFDIRYLFYLPGVRIVNLPLKSLITMRGEHRILNYSISYKGTKLFYKFFDGNKEFNTYISSASQETTDENSILAKIFRETLLNNNNFNTSTSLNLLNQNE